MDLIVWRHAEAVVERPDQDDLQRPLTPKGERQAQRMAEWLNQRLAHSTRVLVSPARAPEALIAATLLTGHPMPWAVKKGAVWWLRNRDREGVAPVVLQAVQSPDCL